MVQERRREKRRLKYEEGEEVEVENVDVRVQSFRVGSVPGARECRPGTTPGFELRRPFRFHPSLPPTIPMQANGVLRHFCRRTPIMLPCPNMLSRSYAKGRKTLRGPLLCNLGHPGLGKGARCIAAVRHDMFIPESSLVESELSSQPMTRNDVAKDMGLSSRRAFECRT
jgi:hypothetical protein